MICCDSGTLCVAVPWRVPGLAAELRDRREQAFVLGDAALATRRLVAQLVAEQPDFRFALFESACDCPSGVQN